MSLVKSKSDKLLPRNSNLIIGVESLNLTNVEEMILSTPYYFSTKILLKPGLFVT